MPGPAWNTDPAGAEATIASNVSAIYRQLVLDAGERREPSLELAAAWHRELYRSVAVPSRSYLGNPRHSDPDHPDLIGYELAVGAKTGVPSRSVPSQLDAFIIGLGQAVTTFDQVIPRGKPAQDPGDVLAVVELAALTHGEWVRIHPYANGNGRTARIWANWIALRYGLPPFVSIRPRPAGTLYERAAAASMGAPPDFHGDHAPTVAAFIDMLHTPPTTT